MSSIIPSASPVPVPIPSAVDAFALLHEPPAVFETRVLIEDCERAISRLRPLASPEDAQDREDLLARHAAATKALAAVPVRRGGAA